MHQPPRLLHLPTEGESGAPVVQSGDWLTVDVDRPPRLGELVVFAVGSRWICHRVIAVRRGFVRTKGDGNALADGWQTLGSVLGTVIAVNGRSPGVWRIGRALRSRFGDACRRVIFLSPTGKTLGRWKRRWMGTRLPVGRWLGLSLSPP